MTLVTAIVALGAGIGAGEADAAGLIAPTRICPNHTATGGAKSMARARRSMTCMVNYARSRKNLRKYRVHRQLTWSAGKKARDILRCDFSHEACGRKFDFWIRRSGYLGEGGWATGENIAWGSGTLGDVRSIFVAWMKSQGHREAILSDRYRDIGVGVTRGSFMQYRGARIWVLHFGDH